MLLCLFLGHLFSSYFFISLSLSICHSLSLCIRTDSERVLHQRVNAVPFNLVGSGQAAVRVLCPLEATGPEMEVIHEKFHQATYGFTDLIGQYLSGEKPKGQLETEEMLKVCLDPVYEFPHLTAILASFHLWRRIVQRCFLFSVDGFICFLYFPSHAHPTSLNIPHNFELMGSSSELGYKGCFLKFSVCVICLPL